MSGRGGVTIQPIHVILSCAALQWVDCHADIFPRLRGELAPGAVLAVQMPAYDTVPNQLMREMAASEHWRKWFPEGRASEWRSQSLDFYYAVLARNAKWLDLWGTDHLQVMPDLDGIVDWSKSTGLSPYLERIRDEAARRHFLEEYRTKLRPFIATSEVGGVPFLFRRLFIVAGV